MNIHFACPRCKSVVRQEFTAETSHLLCNACDTSVKVNEGCVGRMVEGDIDGAVDGGKLTKCLVCPSRDLFVRKNFPQRIGVTIVTIGFALSCVTWYHHMIKSTFAILFATAFLDVVLYLIVGEAVECYRCHARYSGVVDPVSHGAFDLEVHERYRQQQARMVE